MYLLTPILLAALLWALLSIRRTANALHNSEADADTLFSRMASEVHHAAVLKEKYNRLLGENSDLRAKNSALQAELRRKHRRSAL